jgi:dolichol kinase
MYGTMKVFPKTDNKTTWEGIILSAVVNILIAISVLGWSYVPIVMAIAGVIIESFVVKLDDNLAIPLGVAFLGQILS